MSTATAPWGGSPGFIPGPAAVTVVSDTVVLVRKSIGRLRAAMRPRATRLGVERTPFIGREADLAAAFEQVRSGARLITVLGPPGIGKTRLARELAARSRDRFAGGATFCELAHTRSADDILRAIARAFDLTLDGRD